MLNDRSFFVFLIFFQVIADPNERILVMGATNRPQELDDAALRWVRLLVDLWFCTLVFLSHKLAAFFLVSQTVSRNLFVNSFIKRRIMRVLSVLPRTQH